MSRVDWRKSAHLGKCTTCWNEDGGDFRLRKQADRILKANERKSAAKKSNRKTKTKVSGGGIPCPRCGLETQVCRHAAITEKMLRQPFYYDKWFRCKNTQCGTTLIMLEEHKVWRDQPSEVGEPLDDVVLQVLEEMSSDESIPPWEGEDQFVAVRRPPQ